MVKIHRERNSFFRHGRLRLHNNKIVLMQNSIHVVHMDKKIINVTIFHIITENKKYGIRTDTDILIHLIILA